MSHSKRPFQKRLKKSKLPSPAFEKNRKSADKLIALVWKYENFDTLATTMFNELVKKILVHEHREIAGKKNTRNRQKQRKNGNGRTKERPAPRGYCKRHVRFCEHPAKKEPEKAEAKTA
ncbi:MAG: DUF4368 domain-containing protein [Syntrophobacterales bacterium]|nr:DUF4368 domain-containing protein [Syntrophobacterales bacterium]